MAAHPAHHPPNAVTDQWQGLTIHEPINEGVRSMVWRGTYSGRPVAVRRSRRTADSLDWELDLLDFLDRNAFRVPLPFPTTNGMRRVGTWTVHRWIEGEPPTSQLDWERVATELRRLHRVTSGRPQRPSACALTDLGHARRSVDADLDRTPTDVAERCLPHFDAYLEGHRSVIHGDPMAGNIRISSDGRVAFLDWDESRVDTPDLDLANLGIPVLSGTRRKLAEAAADAWETLNGWIVETDYARSRLDQLPLLTRTSPAILSDRIIRLRPRTLADVAAQQRGEDEEIVRWLTGGVATRARIEEHIAHLNTMWTVGGTRRNFGIYPSDRPAELIGNLDINLADVDLELDEANLSYAVFAPWRGRGLAARAVALGVRHLRESEPTAHPVLKIDPANEASIRVAVKAGFEPIRSINWLDEQLLVYRTELGRPW